MNKVAICADSTIDLCPELIEKYGIHIIPLTVNFDNGESYHDGVDINPKMLYQKVKELNSLPHSAAVTPGEFMVKFEELLDEGYDIVWTGIGAKFSRCYENAKMIAEELDLNRIEIVDSANLSSGTSLLVLKACKLREEGKNCHEIAEEMRRLAPLVRSQFAIETMEYLHKGGRCSGVARFLGSVLKIKPIILVRDGGMVVGKKPLGKMKVAMDLQMQMALADKDNIDMDTIFITHSEAFEAAKYFIEEAKKNFPEANIIETNAGCVVSTHCGPGTIGILYLLKK